MFPPIRVSSVFHPWLMNVPGEAMSKAGTAPLRLGGEEQCSGATDGTPMGTSLFLPDGFECTTNRADRRGLPFAQAIPLLLRVSSVANERSLAQQ